MRQNFSGKRYGNDEIMIKILHHLFFIGVIYPVIHILLGLSVRNRHLLPTTGPAILTANHNSHLDAAVLMALFSPQAALKVRPVGATDYWYSNRWIAWFSRHVMGIANVQKKVGNPWRPVMKRWPKGIS
jgi:1-acyl-sn-glycerol-3-phosphate acyltransferase